MNDINMFIPPHTDLRQLVFYWCTGVWGYFGTHTKLVIWELTPPPLVHDLPPSRPGTLPQSDAALCRHNGASLVLGGKEGE